MFNFFRKRRTLKEALGQEKEVIVRGVLFRFKRLDPTCFLNGSQAMQKTFDTYEGKRRDEKTLKEVSERLVKDMQKHHIDIFMNAVTWPKLCRKEEEENDHLTWVGHILKDSEMQYKLYDEIVTYTYGKKKIQSLTLQVQN